MQVSARHDRDKTPLAPENRPSSTISRLESKYSDVLGRVASRRRQEELDALVASREKTLEPERPYLNPVTRSATTMLNGDPSTPYKKERTPYKLTRHRHKYDATDRVTRDLTTALNSRELQQPHHRANASTATSTSTTTPALSAAAAYDPIRRKDTLYDAYGASRTDRTQRHNTDYYLRSRAEKENVQQQPHHHYHHQQQHYHDVDGNNNLGGAAADDGMSDRERERKRAIRSYKRTCTANDRRHTTVYKDLDAINALAPAAADDRPSTSSARFLARQSTAAQAYQRSRTQQFFDAENQLSGAVSSRDEDNPVLSEREARRKEIQGLIAKYAQLDDAVQKRSTAAAAAAIERTPVASYGGVTAKSNGMYGAGGGGLGAAGMSPAMSVQPRAHELLALSKTQSMANMMPSLGGSGRSSRIPKALMTTFVRIIPSRRVLACSLCVCG